MRDCVILHVNCNSVTVCIIIGLSDALLVHDQGVCKSPESSSSFIQVSKMSCRADHSRYSYPLAVCVTDNAGVMDECLSAGGRRTPSLDNFKCCSMPIMSVVFLSACVVCMSIIVVALLSVVNIKPL